MHEFSKITIIGTGKVAKSLAHILYDKNMLHEVYGRNLDRAKKLILNGAHSIKSTDSLDFTNSQSDIFIICVNDSSISTVAQQLTTPPKTTLLHTSGAMDLDVLASKGRHCGILYPVQTFSAEIIKSLEQTPILIDANNDKTSEKVKRLAKSLSQKVYQTSQKERELLHISAVFASNFTNSMVHASHQVLSQTQLPLDLLEPLIRQSINNVILHGPEKALTGPAKRKDQLTIDKHMTLLSSHLELKALYKTLTEYILNSHK